MSSISSQGDSFDGSNDTEDFGPQLLEEQIIVDVEGFFAL
jgi:hypothetical protein